MKIRTCPNCNYRYSLKEYLGKPFWKGVLSHWKCVNCGRKLTTSTSRRLLLAVVGVAPGVFVPYLADFLISAEFSPLVSWGSSVIIFTIWAVAIFSLEVFVLSEEKGEEARNE
jgi:DNA-directed RNA polymerase subunit RPC12/RpoP